MNVLVTGAAGYIGSHAVLRLLADGHTVVALDNLSRGHKAAIDILAQGAADRLTFLQFDAGDRPGVESALRRYKVDAVMHFAAYALVGESVDHPLLYYRNNVVAMISLLEACSSVGVPRFVFSSSCSTYGQPPESMIPVPEDCPKAPMSPYGRSKLIGEQILADVAESQRRANKPFSYACLRYFNVCGCSRTGRLGEDHDPETHIIPVVIQAAMGKRPHVGVFGTDYPTPDGTCVRDYVHVEDLVDAHVAVMNRLLPGEERHYNLGIGKGYSVREIIAAVKQVTGQDFKVLEQPRRPGDPPMVFAKTDKIRRELQWEARITDLGEIVESAWKWFRKHPSGYAGGATP